MAEEKKKNDFGKGLLVGGLVGLGVGVAGTCVADETDPEIEDQEDVQTKDSETENATPGFLGSIVKAAEEARESVSENEESMAEKASDTN